jgi:hypothetical protein
MNNGNRKHLLIGLEVSYIGADKKPHKGKITEVYDQTMARIESLDGNNIAIAAYSESGDINTFSFPSASAKAEKKE